MTDNAISSAPTPIRKFGILGAAGNHRPLTISDLAEPMVMDRTTLTRNLKRLEQGGWIELNPNPNDARSKVVKLTAAGRRTFYRAAPALRRAQKKVLEAYGVRNWMALERNLHALRDAAPSD